MYLSKPVSLSVVGTDLPIWSQIATAATIHRKDEQLFHLVLKEPSLVEVGSDSRIPQSHPFRLVWLEISPDRVIMTMQESQKLSYRHSWVMGVYGVSRYWLADTPDSSPQEMKLRNYTRSLKLKGHLYPEQLSIDYELWAGQLQLGRYVLNLDIEY